VGIGCLLKNANNLQTTIGLKTGNRCLEGEYATKIKSRVEARKTYTSGPFSLIFCEYTDNPQGMTFSYKSNDVPLIKTKVEFELLVNPEIHSADHQKALICDFVKLSTSLYEYILSHKD
jgi:hypothetical protein